MILYNKTFTLTAAAIDPAAVEYIPAEGTIITLNLDAIDGVEEQLYEMGYMGRKKKIKSLYIFVGDAAFSGELYNFVSLCIQHTNGEIEIVPSQWFQFEPHDIIHFLDSQLLAAWEQFVPYKAS